MAILASSRFAALPTRQSPGQACKLLNWGSFLPITKSNVRLLTREGVFLSRLSCCPDSSHPLLLLLSLEPTTNNSNNSFPPPGRRDDTQLPECNAECEHNRAVARKLEPNRKFGTRAHS